MPIILYFLLKDKVSDVFTMRSKPDALDTLNNRISAVEKMAVSEDRVREIVRDEMRPVIESQHDIKISLANITEIVTQTRIKIAKIEAREERDYE